jgi:PKD repeat protein
VSGGATLNLSDCQVSDNAATSIGFGGGIQVFEAKANIDRCTIHSNTAPSGGAGINANTSTVRLVNSTVSKNVTPGTGGGLLIMSHKIGVPSSLNLIYTTVTTNTAAEGAGVHMFGVDMKNFDLKSSIMSGNIVTTPGAPVDISNPFGGSVITADHSLVETGGIPAGNGNIIGVAAKLGNLLYNGASTMTHELLTGSPGMDGGDYTQCVSDPVGARDQAGHKRPHGAQCDMGSFEGDAPGNDPPIALINGPYTGVEGSPITLKLDGLDQDDDPITFFWDFGNGVSGSGPVPPLTYTYPDNPSSPKTTFVVTLTVKDKYGAYDMKTTTATITNVEPNVTASLSAATIVSGGQVQLTGSFTDPGVLDGPWNYEINWGAGLKSQGTAKPGASIIDSRQYCAVGVYAPLLAVTDKDGGKGTKTLSLTVTPLGAQAMFPGAVSLNGAGGGTLTVTLLSTKTFDAVATVDPTTVTLGGPVGPRVGVAKKKNGDPSTGTADANNDGLTDLVLHFDRDALIKAGAITASTTQLVVRATLMNKCTQIEAAAPVAVVP